MKHKRWIIIAVIIAIAFVGIIAIRIVSNTTADPKRGNILTVQVDKVHRMNLVDRINLNGDVTAYQQATLFAKVSGTLDQTYVNMGDAVKAGNILALIDTIELAQTVLQTKATYLNAKLNYERTKNLIDQHLIAQQDVDNAEVTLRTAEANYVTAVTRLGYAHVTAPFSGIITKRFLDAGGVVTQNNSPLFTLMDINRVKIIVNVLEKDIPKLPSVRRAVVSLDALPGREFEGVVRRVSQALDLATRTMEVEIDVANPSHQLKPGMFASVSIIAGERPGCLVVPTQAVMKDNTGSYVFQVANGKAKRTPVVLGVEQDNHFEVVSGLQENEQVIVLGQNQVRNDADVKVQG
ncbi:MAG: efflux RND transporter periplasmic adaptor subunit [Bacteroidota bacterium]